MECTTRGFDALWQPPSDMSTSSSGVSLSENDVDVELRLAGIEATLLSQCGTRAVKRVDEMSLEGGPLMQRFDVEVNQPDETQVPAVWKYEARRSRFALGKTPIADFVMSKCENTMLEVVETKEGGKMQRWGEIVLTGCTTAWELYNSSSNSSSSSSSSSSSNAPKLVVLIDCGDLYFMAGMKRVLEADEKNRAAAMQGMVKNIVEVLTKVHAGLNAGLIEGIEIDIQLFIDSHPALFATTDVTYPKRVQHLEATLQSYSKAASALAQRPYTKDEVYQQLPELLVDTSDSPRWHVRHAAGRSADDVIQATWTDLAMEKDNTLAVVVSHDSDYTWACPTTMKDLCIVNPTRSSLLCIKPATRLAAARLASFTGRGDVATWELTVPFKLAKKALEAGFQIPPFVSSAAKLKNTYLELSQHASPGTYEWFIEMIDSASDEEWVQLEKRYARAMRVHNVHDFGKQDKYIFDTEAHGDVDTKEVERKALWTLCQKLGANAQMLFRVCLNYLRWGATAITLADLDGLADCLLAQTRTVTLEVAKNVDSPLVFVVDKDNHMVCSPVVRAPRRAVSMTHPGRKSKQAKRRRSRRQKRGGDDPWAQDVRVHNAFTCDSDLVDALFVDNKADDEMEWGGGHFQTAAWAAEGACELEDVVDDWTTPVLTRVINRLREDELVQSMQLEVSVKDGRVVIRGPAGCPYHAAVAESIKHDLQAVTLPPEHSSQLQSARKKHQTTTASSAAQTANSHLQSKSGALEQTVKQVSRTLRTEKSVTNAIKAFYSNPVGPRNRVPHTGNNLGIATVSQPRRQDHAATQRREFLVRFAEANNALVRAFNTAVPHALRSEGRLLAEQRASEERRAAEEAKRAESLPTGKRLLRVRVRAMPNKRRRVEVEEVACDDGKDMDYEDPKHEVSDDEDGFFDCEEKEEDEDEDEDAAGESQSEGEVLDLLEKAFYGDVNVAHRWLKECAEAMAHADSTHTVLVLNTHRRDWQHRYPDVQTQVGADEGQLVLLQLGDLGHGHPHDHRPLWTHLAKYFPLEAATAAVGEVRSLATRNATAAAFAGLEAKAKMMPYTKMVETMAAHYSKPDTVVKARLRKLGVRFVHAQYSANSSWADEQKALKEQLMESKLSNWHAFANGVHGNMSTLADAVFSGTARGVAENARSLASAVTISPTTLENIDRYYDKDHLPAPATKEEDDRTWHRFAIFDVFGDEVPHEQRNRREQQAPACLLSWVPEIGSLGSRMLACVTGSAVVCGTVVKVLLFRVPTPMDTIRQFWNDNNMTPTYTLLELLEPTSRAEAYASAVKPKAWTTLKAIVVLKRLYHFYGTTTVDGVLPPHLHGVWERLGCKEHGDVACGKLSVAAIRPPTTDEERTRTVQLLRTYNIAATDPGETKCHTVVLRLLQRQGHRGEVADFWTIPRLTNNASRRDNHHFAAQRHGVGKERDSIDAREMRHVHKVWQNRDAQQLMNNACKRPGEEESTDKVIYFVGKVTWKGIAGGFESWCDFIATQHLVLTVNEFNTSKCCATCGAELNWVPEMGSVKPFGRVKVCEACWEADKTSRHEATVGGAARSMVARTYNTARRCVDRDINAAINIAYAGLLLCLTGGRPNHLQRNQPLVDTENEST